MAAAYAGVTVLLCTWMAEELFLFCTTVFRLTKMQHFNLKQYFKARTFLGTFNQHLRFGFQSPQIPTGISWCTLNMVLLRWQRHLNHSLPSPYCKNFFQVFLYNMAWALLHNCLTTLLAMRKGINSIMQVGKKHTLNMQLEINNLYIQINKLPSPPPPHLPVSWNHCRYCCDALTLGEEIGGIAKIFQSYSRGMDKPCLGTSLWGMLETKTLNSSKSTGSKIRINVRPRSSLNQFYHQGLCNGDCAGPLSTCHISPSQVFLLFVPKSCLGPPLCGCWQWGSA